MKAFIVDDDPSLRAVLSSMLTREGWEIAVAANGENAIKSFAAGRFSLAIMDVDLGEGPDGIEVARKFRETDPGLKIIMISGDSGNAERVQEAGLGPFLQKIFTFAELKSVLYRQTQPETPDNRGEIP